MSVETWVSQKDHDTITARLREASERIYLLESLCADVHAWNDWDEYYAWSERWKFASQSDRETAK